MPPTPVAIQVKPGPASIGSLADAMAWLLDRVDVERISPSRLVADTLKLDRMHALMAALDHPERAFKSVHIAGTKGKGSTCAMTASGLQGCGYTVGLYTSPHLIDLRERVRINGRMIDEAAFVRTAARVAEVAAGLDGAGDLTFFELITALAFVHFADEAVDVAVVEVGLGGRLDSTNVIVPEVTAIANISMDHWQILGDTVEKIAAEKAGIFKPGVPALVIDQQESVLEVCRAAAAQAGAPLRVVGKDIDYSVRSEAGPGGWGSSKNTQMRVSVSGAAGVGSAYSYEHVAVPLRGEHQAGNCGLALAILGELSARGFKTPEGPVTQGLRDVELAGRMELLKTTPRVLLDGAHNGESMKMLMKSIAAQVSYDSMVVIFGCAADKDIDGMLKEVALGADKVIFTRSGNTRAADPRELAKKFTEASGKMCQTAPDFVTALELARRAVGRDDLICVTGSFYLVGEAKERLAAGAKAQNGSRAAR